MRALKAILVAAGKLKRKMPDKKEDSIVMKALMEANVPKFLSHDLPLFKSITSDLFTGVKHEELQLEVLQDALIEACV